MTCEKTIRCRKLAVLSLLFVIGLLVTAKAATRLTFDFTPNLPELYDFGQVNFTTVYGDRGAVGSDGYTYSYGGATADTPNIEVNYGSITLRDASHPEYGWTWSDYVVEFMNSEPGVGWWFEGIANAAASSHAMVVMFKPDPGYAVTIEGVDVSTRNGETVDANSLQVQIFESIDDSLDMTLGFTNEYFNEGYHYKVIYSSERELVTDQRFDISPANISSNKILWLCVWSPRAVNNKNVGIDNISFSQSEREIPAETCAELVNIGFGERMDLNGDCIIDMSDLKLISKEWLANNDPG